MTTVTRGTIVFLMLCSTSTVGKVTVTEPNEERPNHPTEIRLSGTDDAIEITMIPTDVTPYLVKEGTPNALRTSDGKLLQPARAERFQMVMIKGDKRTELGYLVQVYF